MLRITIDNQPLEVPEGTTVLQAAQRLGLEIPSLCHREGCEAENACQVCVVRVDGNPRFVPSCSTVVRDGMAVESESETVRAARRTAIELLLSDHAGDCAAPCKSVCPAHMDIPKMSDQIRRRDFRGALETVKADIPLPAVLGRVCPAPCEAGCRRKPHDAPVSICLLKRFVADVDLEREPDQQFTPPTGESTGKRVAVIGSGPTGLSAAYYLRQRGHGCVVYDDHAEPGGALRYAVPEDVLERDILDGEVDVIRRMGVVFEMNKALGRDITLDGLCAEFDAVVLAFGKVDALDALGLTVQTGAKGVLVHRTTWQTDRPSVFAAGGAVRMAKLAVRSVNEGKVVAASVDQYLGGREVVGVPGEFSVNMGRLDEDELAELMYGKSLSQRTTPAGGLGRGFNLDEAVDESARCMQCSCTCGGDCRMRRYAGQYECEPDRFRGTRRKFKRVYRPGQVVYEPGKCIACGLCVQITRRAGEPLGVSFVGRGFDVEVGVPFGRTIDSGLGKAAAECVAACPTGALYFDQPDDPKRLVPLRVSANTKRTSA